MAEGRWATHIFVEQENTDSDLPGVGGGNATQRLKTGDRDNTDCPGGATLKGRDFYDRVLSFQFIEIRPAI